MVTKVALRNMGDSDIRAERRCGEILLRQRSRHLLRLGGYSDVICVYTLPIAGVNEFIAI